MRGVAASSNPSCKKSRLVVNTRTPLTGRRHAASTHFRAAASERVLHGNLEEPGIRRVVLEEFRTMDLTAARTIRTVATDERSNDSCSSKVDRRSDHNAVQIGRIAGRIAKADGVDAGMQLDLENHWHRIAEGAAVEVEFSGRAVVDG